ncbi:hypothetical protein [Bacillus taeanensis]|uniref:DUF4309 domain-containing protein n=1 Tax=Bacillus taeanensis TaxID=273032 RepID=A0A366XRS3_9BACI|nr:hypothetical protein [Bacillus taeanensis]RBW68597.1 hypothetical protein DS031_15665 [Bacillus taeanensis]
MLKRMIKVTAQILSVLLFVFVIGYDPFAKDTMDFYEDTKSIDLSAEKVKSISIHSTENDVTAAFGKPNDVEEIANPKSKYLSYDEIEFGIAADKVIRYYFTKHYETAKGIKIGDTKEEVIKEYGQNYYERVEGGLNTVGYFDKENKINIEFGFRENKAAAVMVGKVG